MHQSECDPHHSFVDIYIFIFPLRANGPSPDKYPFFTLCEREEKSHTHTPTMSSGRPVYGRQRKKRQISGYDKNTWTEHEDQCLIEQVARHPTGHWATISRALMKSGETPFLCDARGKWGWNSILSLSLSLHVGICRSGKQCKERYCNNLDPTRRHDAWNQDEDVILITLQARLGNRWASMTSFLPGRTANDIKNRCV